VVPVEISASGIDLLVATRWLRDDDAADPVAIGDAVARMIEESSNRYK
jgi:hypothetical protein